MKKFTYILVLVLILASCKGKKDVINIGVISPTSGAGAVTAEYWINGLNMAIDHINASSKGKQFNLIYEDCQSLPSEAVNCYKRLELRGVKYYIAVGGQFALAVAPLTKGKDVILFTTADYNDAILQVTDRALRFFPSAKTMASTSADYVVNTLGFKNIAVISNSAVAQQMVCQDFTKDIESLGATAVFSDTYSIGQSDFKDMITKMSRYPVEAVLFTGFGNSPGAFCTQFASSAKFQGATVIGDMNLFTRDFINSVKNAPLHVYYSDTKLSDDFDKLYHERFGTESNAISSCSYVIPFLFQEAINANKNINDQLAYLKGRTFDTAMGQIQIDESGNTEMPMTTYQLQ